ncbi:MAG: hypothetical protein M3434_12165 [Gemmatimonadota bacterium]|nr:hypothetical protein [Gemmatimonadota bacterium]
MQENRRAGDVTVHALPEHPQKQRVGGYASPVQLARHIQPVHKLEHLPVPSGWSILLEDDQPIFADVIELVRLIHTGALLPPHVPDGDGIEHYSGFI